MGSGHIAGARARTAAALGAAAVLIVLVANAGRLLVVNDPKAADAIIVLDGGTWDRTISGLALLRARMAPTLVLDVDGNSDIWGTPEPILARRWADALPPPQPAETVICSEWGLSTLDEARSALGCLPAGAHTVLIVTSAYHTRRAVSIFRHADPTRHYTSYAVDEPRYFGQPWWRHREWAKTTLMETSKLVVWEMIDRWR